MIWFVYGVPRTGKTLFGGLVDAIIPSLKRGRRVYTNIPLIRLGVCRECHISVMEYNRLVNKVICLQDVFEIYDPETQNIKREYLDTVFVLDEFRALKGLNAKTEEYLSKILNVVSKSAVDFYFIAQLPKYFDDDTRNLGEGCTVYERGDKKGKKNHSIEYTFDSKGGTPIKVGTHWETDYWQYRYRDPKYFLMYHSYSQESEDLMLERGEDHKYIIWWKKKSVKIAAICLVLLLIIFVILGILFKSTTDTLHAFQNSKKNEVKQEQTKINPGNNLNKVQIIKSSEKICYKQIWVNDGIVTYKLNNGNYAYNPSHLIERCMPVDSAE